MAQRCANLQALNLHSKKLYFQHTSEEVARWAEDVAPEPDAPCWARAITAASMALRRFGMSVSSSPGRMQSSVVWTVLRQHLQCPARFAFPMKHILYEDGSIVPTASSRKPLPGVCRYHRKSPTLTPQTPDWPG